jgi:type IV pilus assembly protein PilQ
MTRTFHFLAHVAIALLLPLTAQAQSADNSIDTLQIGQSNGVTTVKIGLRQALTEVPSSFSVAEPARIVFDFPRVSNGLGRSTEPSDKGELRSVNVVQAGDRTRVVLNLKQMAPFEVKLDAGFVLISLQSTPLAAAATVSKPEKPAQHFPEMKAKDSPEHAIRDVAFRRSANGEGVVTIDLADTTTGVNVRQQGGSLIVDFEKTKLPENLRRKLDVMDFATPVTTVTSTTVGENARVTITPTGLWEHAAYQTDNQFVVQVKPLKEDPNKLFQGTQQRGYQGDKISLNFQNIPLRELLYVFADITGFNLVVADNVTGNVSLRLNDVPWDQALEMIMQQYGLMQVKEGNVVQIDTVASFVKRNDEKAKAKKAQEDVEAVVSESFRINYQKPADILRKLQEAKYITTRGKALVDEHTRQIFVTETPSNLEQIRDFLRKVDVQNRQVLIEAKYVAASENFGRDLGVKLGFTNTKQTFLRKGEPAILIAQPQITTEGVNSDTLTGFGGGSTGGQGSIGQIVTTGGTVGKPMSMSTGLPGGDQLKLSLFNANVTRVLDLELRAAETDGKTKSIASPRVVTYDNGTANISDGSTVYLPTTSSTGQVTQLAINANLSLSVTPQITPDGQILMKGLAITRNRPGAISGASAQIFTSTVTTDVMVENGGTIVLGGVTTSDDTEGVQKVPFLGDLPVVGALFRSKNVTRSRTELLVFITPRILPTN